MRVRLRGIQGVLRTRGDSLTQEAGRNSSQEQAEGQFPGISGQVWIPVLPHSVCVTWNKLPNLSVPRFLIDNMGVLIAPTQSGCFKD